MKKIFITTKNLNIGGVETSLIFLINNLIKNGYEIDLMLYEPGTLINKLDNRVNILNYTDYYKDERETKFYKLKKNILLNTLLKKYKSFNKKYDISIAYNGFDNYLDVLALSVDSKLKIIWDHNDFYSSIKSKRFKLIYKIMYKIMGRKFKKFNKIVCVSKYAELNFNKLFSMKEKTCTCHNYVDENYIIKSMNNITKIKMSRDKFNIVAVGRLTKLKNFDKLILLANKLKEQYNDFKVYIIGDGEEKNYLNNLIKSYNLENYVILLGEQHDELYSIMKQANLLISMSEYESFGNVLIEGLVLKIPYLSNINSGSKDIFESYKSGIIIENKFMLSKLIDIICGKSINVTFDIKEYNENINKKILKILK